MSEYERRHVESQERIADVLEEFAKLFQQWFDKVYPQRPEVRDATITKVPSEEDKIRDIHGPDVDEEEFIGELEREIINQSRKGS